MEPRVLLCYEVTMMTLYIIAPLYCTTPLSYDFYSLIV